MGRLSNIQVLRAIAALLVIVSHAVHETVEMAGAFHQPALTTGFHPWTAAVDVFFIMSGFILVAISYDKFGTADASGDFFLRRLVRAVPLYWLLTSLLLATAALAPRMLNVPISDALQVLASYAFIPYPRGEGELRPVLALGWTMNLEMAFYLVLALSLSFSRRIGLSIIGTLLVGVVLLQQVAMSDSHALAFYGSSMTLDFVLGTGIAVAYQRGWRLPAWACWAGGALGLALILDAASADSTELRWFWTISLPAALLVAAAVFGPQLPTARVWQRWLILVGDACYSVYLLQPFLLRPTAKLWAAIVGPRLSLWVYVGVGSFVALAAGVACFVLFETPLTRYLNGQLRTRERRRDDRRMATVPAE
jgi:exopolysaccharide production protein ExoZ